MVGRDILSFAGFAEFLDRVAHRPTHHTEAQLRAVGRLVQRRAQEYLGIYQAGAGPIRPWRVLADQTISEKVRKGFIPSSPSIDQHLPLFRTGEMQRSIDYTVELYTPWSGKVTIGSPLAKALFQELGTAKMPPRSFLGLALMRSQKRIHTLLGKELIESRFNVRMLSAGFPQSRVKSTPVRNVAVQRAAVVP